MHVGRNNGKIISIRGSNVGHESKSTIGRVSITDFNVYDDGKINVTRGIINRKGNIFRINNMIKCGRGVVKNLNRVRTIMAVYKSESSGEGASDGNFKIDLKWDK